MTEPRLMPNASEIEFKPAFVERYSKLTDFEAFKTCSLSFPRRSIRINTLKKTVTEVKKRLEGQGWKLDQIPWCLEGFWVEHEKGRRDIGNTPEHMLGYYYVQEAVSMIPPLALDPQPGEIILDMCASPGSKSSQIAQMMKNEGILIANDYQGIRLAPLGINLQRMGITNSIITLMEGRYFEKSGIQFDRILVDAPCSGTGTIRKSIKTLRIWNPNAIKRLAGTQRQLIKVAYDILTPGGTMVYSTCSCEPEENEGIIDHLLNERQGAELVPFALPLKRSDPITVFGKFTYSDEVRKTLRLWPQDNNTEGFFVAKIRKSNDL